MSLNLVSALNITSPLNNTNLTYASTYSWQGLNTTTTPASSYLIYLNGTLVNTYSNLISDSTTSYYSDTTAGTFELAYQYNLSGNRIASVPLSVGLYAQPFGSGSTYRAYLVINYTNGTVYTTEISSKGVSDIASGCVDSWTFSSNVTNTVGINNIKVYTDEDDNSRVIGVCGLSYTNESIPSKSTSFNSYSFVENLGTYVLNVSAVNSTGSVVDSNITYVHLIYNGIVNITALNYTGVSLSIFTINITDLTTNVSRVQTTTSGNNVIELIKSRNYNMTINASGFVTSTVSYSTASNYSTYQFTLYPSSSLFINISDETTFNLITQNITVTLTDISNPSIRSGTTTSGNISFTNLRANDVWEVKFTSENYSDTRYYRIILAEGTDYLNAYLLPKSISENFSICWYDSNGVAVNSLHIYQFILSNGEYVLTQDYYTDIQGKSFFSFNPSSYYLYNYSSTTLNNGKYYTVQPFILNPPQNSAVLADNCNYDITVRSAASSLVYSALNISAYTVYNNNTNNITFYYDSNENFTNYSYTVSLFFNNQNFVICSESSNSSQDSFICDVSGYRGVVYTQGVADNEVVFFSGYTQLRELPTLFDNLTPEDAAFYSGMIILIITIGGLAFGFTGVLVSSIVGVTAVYWLGLSSPLTLTLIAADVVVIVIINLALKRRY